MIVFQNVSKSFGNHKILDNINIEFADNTITCLIGESGCGKTTLLKMINRLIEPTTGTVVINGKDISKENVIGGVTEAEAKEILKLKRMQTRTNAVRRRQTFFFASLMFVNL